MGILGAVVFAPPFPHIFLFPPRRPAHGRVRAAARRKKRSGCTRSAHLFGPHDSLPAEAARQVREKRPSPTPPKRERVRGARVRNGQAEVQGCTAHGGAGRGKDGTGRENVNATRKSPDGVSDANVKTQVTGARNRRPAGPVRNVGKASSVSGERKCDGPCTHDLRGDGDVK